MRQRIIKTEHAQYDQSDWTGANTSGWTPFGSAVLVLPDKASKKVGKNSSIYVPDEVVDMNTMASETGVLIALADGAWLFTEAGDSYEGKLRPKPGDRVIFQRYAGRHFVGHDGLSYRVMTDNCIAAVETAAPPDVSEALAASGVTIAEPAAAEKEAAANG